MYLHSQHGYPSSIHECEGEERHYFLLSVSLSLALALFLGLLSHLFAAGHRVLRRCLLHEVEGEESDLPAVIPDVRVVDVQHVCVDEVLRRRFKCLGHLPQMSQATLVDINLRKSRAADPAKGKNPRRKRTLRRAFLIRLSSSPSSLHTLSGSPVNNTRQASPVQYDSHRGHALT